MYISSFGRRKKNPTSMISIALIYILAHSLPVLGYGSNPNDADVLCCPAATEDEYHDLRMKLNEQNLDILERIQCDNITKREFDAQYSKPQKPVILVGCDKSSLSQDRWSFEQLASRFDKETLWRATVGDNFMDNADTKNARWEEITHAMQHDETFNLFDNLDSPHGKMLEEDYDWPSFLKGTDVHDFFATVPPVDYGSMRWFGMATFLTGTHVHYDPHETDAWNTVTQGEKWWFLFPPEVEPDFPLECDPKCSTPDPSVLDFYVGVLTSESPLVQDFTKKHLSHAFQQAGETMYLPIRYMHSVLNTQDTIFITANYANDVNLNKGVWENIKLYARPDEMANYYCNILSEDQRSALNLGDHDDSIECDPEKGDGLYEPKAKGSIQWLRHLNQVDPTLLHARDDRGWLPIHYAAETSDVTAIRFLLNRGADANARIEKHVEKKDDNDKGERGRVLKEELRLGWTPLDILREKNGELNGAFRFLTMYQETEGYTAIDAAHFGDILFLQDLVEMKYGDLLHQVDENGWLPIHEAARSGQIEILTFLVENGADINSHVVFYDDEEGVPDTPISLAMENLEEGHPIIKFIIAHSDFEEPEL